MAEEKMEISLSSEIRFTDERGKYLAKQINLKKIPAPRLLRNPGIEKDLPKYPLSPVWNPSRKVEPLEKKAGVRERSL